MGLKGTKYGFSARFHHEQIFLVKQKANFSKTKGCYPLGFESKHDFFQNLKTKCVQHHNV
jgi:hypothetical protein